MSKITLIGGGGIRTPFLVYGLNEAADETGATELVLYDVDQDRANLMAALGNAVVRKYGGRLKVSVDERFESAVDGTGFVINSIRVGGMECRANDERIVKEHGLAGQETTGPGGLAMALRTIPVTLEYAKAVERLAPSAWFINFTNPAGLITQAITTQTGVRSVGICDTPPELMHRVAHAIGGTMDSVACEYFGLNHLGWIRSVKRHGQEVIAELLNSDEKINSLYPAGLFDPAMIRELQLIPTEYLYFCYEQRRAVANQAKAGTTRGQEVVSLTNEFLHDLHQELSAGRDGEAIELFISYHCKRIGSYMKLESSAGSLLAPGVEDPGDPFTSATGYHRIALSVMKALSSEAPQTLIVNTSNRGAIHDLQADDVVEVPCEISRHGIVPLPVGSVPAQIRGLLLSVKAYERFAVQAAVEHSAAKARLALLLYPIIGQWELATKVLEALIDGSPNYLGYLRE